MLLQKKSWKNIIIISIMVLLFVASVFSVTFAYFSNKKENTITINTAKLSAVTTIEDSQNLQTSDLIADNAFSKTINYNVTTNYDIYYRVYAVVTMQTHDTNGVDIVERTDLINVTNVSNTSKGQDNKWYYVASNTQPTSVGTGEYSFTFTFKVSPLVSEELLLNASGEVDKNLKTTVTYYFEYCQVSGFDDWSGFSD